MTTTHTIKKDGRHTPLSVTIDWQTKDRIAPPHPAVITGWEERKTKDGRDYLVLYFDRLGMNSDPEAGMFDGLAVKNNSVQIWFNHPKSPHKTGMGDFLKKRAAAIEDTEYLLGNDLDVVDIIASGKYDDLIGLHCGVDIVDKPGVGICSWALCFIDLADYMTDDDYYWGHPDPEANVAKLEELAKPCTLADLTVTSDGWPTIYVDSRQKNGKHHEKHGAMMMAGYRLERVTLPVGDYVLAGQPLISVDSKRSLAEVAENLAPEDWPRFSRELLEAQKLDIDLTILITTDIPIRDYVHPRCASCPHGSPDTCPGHECSINGTSKPLNAGELVWMLRKVEEIYGVHVLMVNSEHCAAEEIIHILTGGGIND